MKKELFILCLAVSLLFSYTNTAPDDISTPAGYEEIAQAEGDLDKDKIAEKVVVYRTPNGSEMRIFKRQSGKWELMHKSKGAILLDSDNIVLQFYSINVEHGCIVIYHKEPGRGEWSYTHRYRQQNGKWKLIGVTEHSGYYCSYMSDTDCNLSTGKVVYDYTKYKCDAAYNETILEEKHEEYMVKLAGLPDMDEVSVSEHEVKVVGGDFRVNY